MLPHGTFCCPRCETWALAGSRQRADPSVCPELRLTSPNPSSPELGQKRPKWPSSLLCPDPPQHQAWPCSPAFVAATHQVILLYSVRQELGPAEGQTDVGQQLRQAGPPLLLVVSDPSQSSFKDLPGQSGRSGGNTSQPQVTPLNPPTSRPPFAL